MTTKKLLLFAPILFLMACGAGGNESMYDGNPSAAPESVVQNDSTAATEQTAINSPERKVIRTADFRCKVNNVFTATTSLEDMVKAVGGVVQDSHIDNNNSDVTTTYYTADSLRKTQIFTTTSTLTLRVPVAYLDSLLRAIPGLTSFIDSRTIKQSDVTYKYIANELKNRVGENKTTTARAMQLAKKSKEPIEVQEYENDRQERKIERKMENMQIIDDVTYATVTVAFSQPEQVFTQIVVDPSYYNQNPFLLRCKEALYSGWSFLVGFVIGIVNIWPILILAVAAWFVFRKFRGRRLVLARK